LLTFISQLFMGSIYAFGFSFGYTFGVCTFHLYAILRHIFHSAKNAWKMFAKDFLFELNILIYKLISCQLHWKLLQISCKLKDHFIRSLFYWKPCGSRYHCRCSSIMGSSMLQSKIPNETHVNDFSDYCFSGESTFLILLKWKFDYL